MFDLVQIIEQRWPGWKVDRPLGAGGFGRLYAIKHESVIGETWAAVKAIVIPRGEEEIDYLRLEGLNDEQIDTQLYGRVKNLGREIQLMDQVKGHANIVNIEFHDVVRLPESLRYVVLIRMELLTPLQSILSRMTRDDAIRMGIDICRALSICHSRSIVHRDIKPENIFVNAYGDYKLGDFGVSRSLEQSTYGFTRTGTYLFMAPEVYNNQACHADMEAAAKIDIYSLGMTLYTLLNNMRVPFLPPKGMFTEQQRTAALLDRMAGKTLPTPCRATPDLAAVVLRACAFRPEDRYATAQVFQRALEALLMSNGMTEREDDCIRRENEERRQREEAERRQREEAERRQREEAERRQREEAAHRQREEAAHRQREVAEQARLEAEERNRRKEEQRLRYEEENKRILEEEQRRQRESDERRWQAELRRREAEKRKKQAEEEGFNRKEEAEHRKKYQRSVKRGRDGFIPSLPFHCT